MRIRYALPGLATIYGENLTARPDLRANSVVDKASTCMCRRYEIIGSDAKHFRVLIADLSENLLVSS